MLSAINIPTHAPDLLDRSLLICLDRIPPDRRRREDELARAFDAARPAILGGLLDALSGAMRVYPVLEIPELPRMADFATWGAAVAEALGISLPVDGKVLRGAEAFLAAYTENVGHQTEEVLESDPVARAVRDFAHENGTWTGTASALLAALGAKHEAQMKAKDGGWPKRADGLSRRLTVLQSTLADTGVSLRRNGRTNAARTITLSVEGRHDASSATPRHPSAPEAVRPGDALGDGIFPGVTAGVTPNPAWAEARAIDDADDASTPLFSAPGRKVVNL